MTAPAFPPSSLADAFGPGWSDLSTITFYRGYATPDPWRSRSRPAFTDVRQVAESYAAIYRADQGSSRVGSFRLRLQRPLFLGNLHEDTVDLCDVRDRLAPVFPNFDLWWQTRPDTWRAAGNWVSPADLSHFDPRDLYADTHAIANDPSVLHAALRAGYDSFIYRGVFAHDRPLTERIGSYDPDTFSVAEARPFHRAQVTALDAWPSDRPRPDRRPFPPFRT